MTLFRALTLCFLVALFAAPAQAALDPAASERLKAQITETLEQLKQKQAARGVQLTFEGAVAVEQNSTYLAITLPHMKYIARDRSTVDLGIIAINAAPGTPPGRWNFTAALPTAIVFRDAAGQNSGVLRIGEQMFAAVYDENFRNFLQMDARYKNLSIEGGSGSKNATIGDVSYTYELMEDAGTKRWSGPAKVILNDLVVVEPDTSGKATLKTMQIDMGTYGFSFTDHLAFQDQVEAIAESAKLDGPEGVNVSGAHAQGLYNLFFNYMTSVWDGFDMKISTQGFSLSQPNKTPGGGPTNVNLGDLTVFFSMKGFRDPKLTMQTTVSMKDLAIDPPPPTFDQATPSTLNIDMTVNNLPFRDIGKLGKQALDHSVANPGAAQMTMLQTMMTAPQILTQAGTTLSLRDTGMSNKDYNLTLKGDVTANAQALMGATGTARMDVEGIDVIIAGLNERIANPTIDAVRKARAEQALSGFTMLRMVGKEDPTNKNRRSYDFELTPEGKMMLNGTDIQTLTGATPPAVGGMPAP